MGVIYKLPPGAAPTIELITKLSRAEFVYRSLGHGAFKILKANVYRRTGCIVDRSWLALYFIEAILIKLFTGRGNANET